MKVIFQGQTIDLDANKLLGSGGEANIIKHGKFAFKIYHDPTAQRAEKIQSFLSRKVTFCPNVLAPVDVVNNVKGKIIGFVMPVADKCKDFINLFDTGFRSKQQINSNDIAKLFLNVVSTLEKIHNQKFIIGDLNDLNLLFNDSLESIFIDVDSYQFDKYPCIVGTDTYLDPNLYGVDLTKKPSFSVNTDYYSLAVMLFKALLFVHPYGGVHNKFKSLYNRAQSKVWVFEKGVIYPKIGRHPETLDDKLLQYFADVFCKGGRSIVPKSIIDSMQDGFTQCKSCGAYFTKTRSKCPQCQKVTPAQAVDLSNIIAKKQIGHEQCDVVKVFETSGVILFVKVIDGNELIIVSYDGKNTVCDVVVNDQRHSVILWPGLIKQFKYDYFKPYCLVTVKEELMVLLDVSKEVVKLITKTSTMLYLGEPVFACARDQLYRLTQTMVISTKLMPHTTNLIDQSITASMADQTWLSVGQNGFGLGFYRVFSDYKFFTFSDKGRFEVDLPKLEGQLIDLDVRVSVNTLILLRKNLHQGQTYSHWHIIDVDGKVLETKSEESINSDLLKNIYGKELVGSSIVHSTDAGVVIEKHGDISLKVSTAEFVDSDSKLFLYKQGLLAVLERKINYLRLM